MNHKTSNHKSLSITNDSVAILNRFHVDQIYRTRANRAWCKERGIRLSGPPLGRRPANRSPELLKQQHEDERSRNAIEGQFGQAKRRFSLGRIMAKLSDTAESSIAITFLVMNLFDAIFLFGQK